MQWKCVKFAELSPLELYQLLRLRVDVFVVEQTCPYPELDGKDILAGVYHLIGYQENELVACARLLPQGVSFSEVSIGRVATNKNHRGAGLGHQLLQTAIEFCLTYWPNCDITIGAQSHLEAYYQQHGFKKASEEYLEDDIPHIDMTRKNKD
ncbi:GNAT family N-acetyltransferase [Vibrio sp. S11_S32]|uniref:GNAT family N-acetyltransferase n=1 Tax=Vibrio sp. S11_S32 TaxID=2720225 RepID=UPI001680B860|nr:GNAT family N-acetyltransferase [Vibrio sp. S11_S32]MBD1576349.1 GNAT family N-acetyltransferase [Vibrio sp. S11_S32]